MNKDLEISRQIYILGLIFLPFFILPFSENPYTLPKTFFVAAISLLSLLFFFFSRPTKIYFPNNLFLFLILLEFINFIFFDNYFLFPRYSEGFLVTGIVFTYLFLTLNLFENLNLEKIIFYSSILVIFSSLIDIFILNSRASGTLGQANFLGIFLVISLLSFIKIKNEDFKVNKYFEFLYLIVLGVLFIKSASLASLIALVTGIFFIKLDFKKIPRHIIFAGVGILTIAVVLFGGIFSAKVLDTYNQLLRPKQTIISDSFLIRQKIWVQTFEIFKTNPSKLLLGFGANNFNYYFEKSRGTVLNGYSEANLLFDKPHNYFLELIFNYGIVYLVIFVYVLLLALKTKKYNFLLIPLLIFLLFNWLDIYLKIIFFTLLFIELPKIEIKSPKIVSFLNLMLFITSIFLTSFFSNLMYKDYLFSNGDPRYIFSMNRQDFIDLKIKDPLTLISASEYLNKAEKGKIFEYLIKNFPNNSAILFQLNKLF